MHVHRPRLHASSLLPRQIAFPKAIRLCSKTPVRHSALIGNRLSVQLDSADSPQASSDGTFTITAIPEPSTYLAAAGLLALFLWPARRRLIKDAKSILGLRPTGRERIEAYRNA